MSRDVPDPAASSVPTSSVEVFPVTGVGEIASGVDLCELLARAWLEAGTPVRDDDVVVVTSKVVSKAEGRVVAASPGADAAADARAVAIESETDREVARRGATRIVRTRHGFVMAAAGVDASNVAPGSVVLLPLDPDASAARLRAGFAERGARVAVVVSDTSGRAWREGQTDIALGAAGLRVLDDHTGRVDRYGNPLLVTAPAVADEIAGLADLAAGKLSGSPAVLVRGLGRFLLRVDEPDVGAAALVRAEDTDMFGLGAREAVVAALAPSSSESGRGFGAPVTAGELLGALARGLADLGLLAHQVLLSGGDVAVDLSLGEVSDLDAGRAEVTFDALARAHGWTPTRAPDGGLVASPRL